MRAVLCPLTADPYICPVPANGCNVLIKDEICPVFGFTNHVHRPRRI